MNKAKLSVCMDFSFCTKGSKGSKLYNTQTVLVSHFKEDAENSGEA